MSVIAAVELHLFHFTVANLGLAGHSAAGVGNLAYVPGAQLAADALCRPHPL